jgi:hypothetical protein
MSPGHVEPVTLHSGTSDFLGKAFVKIVSRTLLIDLPGFQPMVLAYSEAIRCLC